MKPLARTYHRLVLAGLGTAVALAVLGYYPTLRLAGSDALGAMLAGIAISLLAGCVGAVPISLAGQGDRSSAPQAILLATVIRFILVLAMTAVGLLADWFDRAVLATWVGTAYLAMLCVDSIYAVRLIGTGRIEGAAGIDP